MLQQNVLGIQNFRIDFRTHPLRSILYSQLKISSLLLFFSTPIFSLYRASGKFVMYIKIHIHRYALFFLRRDVDGNTLKNLCEKRRYKRSRLPTIFEYPTFICVYATGGRYICYDSNLSWTYFWNVFTTNYK